ncbi:MAG: sigma-70 family RNA polymerase sigma factor [Chloracidobacterium sp.]|nr:sigma-70 family RNA polymerase sigma factor [Chloracidobacterium sp.]
MASSEITRLLNEARAGNEEALNEVFPFVYDELRLLASNYLSRERVGHTLQATALVHEVYLKLTNQTEFDWDDRSHFFAIAARSMRQILVDHARARSRSKRGGGSRPVAIDAELVPAMVRDPELAIGIDEALTKLEELDPRQAKIVELRIFSGLGVPETAKLIGVSEPTVKREWATAKLFLRKEIG